MIMCGCMCVYACARVFARARACEARFDLRFAQFAGACSLLNGEKDCYVMLLPKRR